MDDTISRAAVLEIIREYCPDEPKSKDLREYWAKRFEPLIKVREEVEKLPLSNGWIPCKERMPKKSGEYIVSGKWGSGKVSVGSCEYSKTDGYFRTAWNFDVLAWMPLPAAYQEGGKE